MTLGKFITVEGIEGAGKSTNIGVVKDFLQERDIDLVTTREPGGTIYAEHIRELLLSHQDEPLDSNAELLLVFAARAQHLNHLICPALERGAWVLSDRFTDATYAYQGAGRGLGVEKVAALEEFVQGSLRPDLTLILDVPVDVGFGRVDSRGSRDRFESEQQHFFETVRSAYLERAQTSPERYAVIDTTRSLDEIRDDIESRLNTLLDNVLQQQGVD